MRLRRVSPEEAAAILRGEPGPVPAGEGWPTADGLDALRMGGDVFLAVVDGVVIGDCGTHGEPDEQGDVEIGYGLAPMYRGRGHGVAMVRSLVESLLARDDVRRLTATGVAAANAPSRRVLERLGFELLAEDEVQASYALSR